MWSCPFIHELFPRELDILHTLSRGDTHESVFYKTEKTMTACYLHETMNNIVPMSKSTSASQLAERKLQI